VFPSHPCSSSCETLRGCLSRSRPATPPAASTVASCTVRYARRSSTPCARAGSAALRSIPPPAALPARSVCLKSEFFSFRGEARVPFGENLAIKSIIQEGDVWRTEWAAMPRDYYEVLGVEKGADKKAIEKA
jgi:hypothetical protein